MEFENILKLIESVSNSSLSNFTLEEGGTKITLEANRGNNTISVSTSEGNNTSHSNAGSEFMVTSSNSNNEIKASTIVESKAVVKGNIIKSPLVGVFYSSASPDVDAFVKVGDRVSVGQTLGIVEAMKLMNEIECEYDGIVKEILIKNESIVEFGQSLFVIA